MPKPDGPKEADRRRAWMIKTLFANGRVNVNELRNNRPFMRSFRATTPPTLYGDLNTIEEMLNNLRLHILERQEGQLQLILPRQYAFGDCGFSPDGNGNSLAPAKARIAKYIIKNSLVETDVVYMSTGTTVFHVAVELLKSPERRASKIFTHNLGIVDLFRHQGRLFPSHGIALEILGGTADYKNADIVPTDSLPPLPDVRCSKLIMSCDFLNAATGQVFSHQQPELKKRVLQSTQTGNLIMPVTPEKIEYPGHPGRDAGGHRIELPDPESVKRTVVTTDLPADARALLAQNRFEVLVVSASAGGVDLGIAS